MVVGHSPTFIWVHILLPSTWCTKLAAKIWYVPRNLMDGAAALSPKEPQPLNIVSRFLGKTKPRPKDIASCAPCKFGMIFRFYDNRNSQLTVKMLVAKSWQLTRGSSKLHPSAPFSTWSLSSVVASTLYCSNLCHMHQSIPTPKELVPFPRRLSFLITSPFGLKVAEIHPLPFHVKL